MWSSGRRKFLVLALVLVFGGAPACGAQTDQQTEDKNSRAAGDAVMMDHESHEAMQQPSSHDEADGKAGEAKREAEVSAGVASTWAEIQTKRNEIEKLITTGKLDGIHEVAEGLPGLGENLVKESGDLDEARLRRVQGAVGQLANLADSLHDAADKGDAQTTEAEFKKLDGLLRVIEAQYPEGALSVTSPGSGAKETGEMESGHGGSGDGHDHARQNRRAKVDVPSNAQRIDVVASDFRFEPQEVVVRAGVPVALTISNQGKNEHAWVISTQSDVHLHVLPGGQQTQVFTIENPGEYKIACTVAGHEQLGMVGKIIVQ